MKRRLLYLAGSFALVVGIIYYFLDLSPMTTDNFLFSRDMRPGYARFYSGSPIESLEPMTAEAAFRQATEMYFTWCGRFAGNMAVYLLFMLPRWLYNILAALVFGLYIFLLQVCVFGRSWRKGVSAKWTLALAGMLWLGIPSFGEAFLWLSVGGQIALLGQALVFLPFRFSLDALPSHNSTLSLAARCVGLFLLGAIVASLDYPTSAALPTTGAACVLWLWFRQRKDARRVPWLSLFATLGLGAGAIITLAAPGNAERMLLTNDTSVISYLAMGWTERIALYLQNLPGGILMQYVPLILLLWSGAALRQKWHGDWLRHWPTPSLLFFLPAILTYAAYLFTAWPPPRAFATPAAQLIVGASIVYVAAAPSASMPMKRRFGIIRAVFCAICVIVALYQGVIFYQLDKIVAERERIIGTSGEDTVIVPEIPMKNSWYWPLWCSSDAKQDSDYWVNRAMAAYYGVKKIATAGPPPKFYRVDEDYGPDSSSKPRIALEDGRFRVDFKSSSENNPSALHLYYYGDRALLNKLPTWLGNLIVNWLYDANQGDLRTLLAPILLARTDIPLSSDPASNRSGKSALARLENTEKLWLVRPGEGKFSFDLVKLSPTDKI